MVDDRVRDRIQQLIAEADWLTRVEVGEPVDDTRRFECSGWLLSVQHVIEILLGSSKSPHREKIVELANKEYGYRVHEAVAEITAILESLQRDIAAGLVTSITDQARAETFDDFLDHAEFYVQQERKNEAGVIAGVVFEDSLRRVCRKQQILEKDVKLDQLISQLTSNGTFTAVKAKRARVAAHVRTKASHAQWDEFEMADVQATLAFTHEFIAANLDS